MYQASHVQCTKTFSNPTTNVEHTIHTLYLEVCRVSIKQHKNDNLKSFHYRRFYIHTVLHMTANSHVVSVTN